MKRMPWLQPVLKLERQKGRQISINKSQYGILVGGVKPYILIKQ